MTDPTDSSSSIFRPGGPSLIRRREFLKKATGAVAVFSLGGLSACGDDDFDGPSGDAYTVWVAQRVQGTVQHLVTHDGIPDASVILTMGFDPKSLFTVSTTVTGPRGEFDFVRAEETGEPGDFWIFRLPDPSPVQVYIRLTVQHLNFWPAYPVKQFIRTPSNEKPSRQFELYNFQFSVPMTQVTE